MAAGQEKARLSRPVSEDESTGSRTAPAGGSAAEPSEAVRFAKRLLSDAGTDPGAVRDALDALTEHDLTTAWSGPSAMLNTLSVFAETKSLEDIRQTAAQASRNVLWRGWEFRHHSHLLALGGDPQVELPGFPPPSLSALVDAGRGVVVAPLQFGDARNLQFAAASVRLHSTFALSADTYAQYAPMRDACPDAPLWAYTHFVDVEATGGAFKLMRALRSGGVVGAFVDGNAGADGYFGNTARAGFRFLGYDVRVKYGFAELAAASGSPILPILPSGLRMSQCRVWPLIDPGGRLRGPEAKQFAMEAVRQIYAYYEPYVLRYPEEWGQLHLFHRWRTPEAPAAEPPMIETRKVLEDDLDRGLSYRINPRRIVSVREEVGTRLIDVRTLKSVKISSELQPVVEGLRRTDGGVDRNWLFAQDASARERALDLLSTLKGRDAIEPFREHGSRNVQEEVVM